MLTNLITNAVKFTEQGEVILRARWSSETDDHVRVRFEIRDTGIGIANEQRAMLFLPFSQADSSTTRKYGGSGLGPAISKQFIQMMGGDIEVMSQPGQGSTFFFTLTFAKATVDAANPGPASEIDLCGRSALIVDDNATNQDILERQVASWGMQSQSATGGPEAIALLQQAAERDKRFDLAILDYAIPGMDGVKLAEAIQADPAITAMPMVILSSMSDSIPFQAGTSKVAAVLTKPVRQSRLRATLVTAVKPQAERSHEADREVIPEPGNQAGSPRQSNEGLVLVAEDNVVNQQVARQMLRKLGYDVDIVSDGYAAVEAVSNNAYVAILMDIQMPRLDGLSSTGEIRKRSGPGAATPIIAMTANAMPGDREQCIVSGMDDYLAKPIRSEALQSVLDRHVSKDTAGAGTSLASSALTLVTDVIDWQHLEGLRELQQEGEEDILGELIDLFVADAPERLSALAAAVEGGDANGVRSEAHALKGSCANLGAIQMAQACAEIEARARDNDIREAPRLLSELNTEFDRARAALSTEVGVA